MNTTEHDLYFRMLTLNEFRTKMGSRPYEDEFPEELKFLGIILGNLILNESMIEINKMVIDVRLEGYKLEVLSLFTNAVAMKVTVSFVTGTMAIIDNKSFNDLVAYTLKKYFSMLEDYAPSRLLN